jgi:hypothetical protein
MPDNPSHKRRELAAQCLAFAEQTSDLNVRAKLVAMAQKWLDLANDEFGSHEELDAWNKTFYDRVVQTKIGQAFENGNAARRLLRPRPQY